MCTPVRMCDVNDAETRAPTLTSDRQCGTVECDPGQFNMGGGVCVDCAAGTFQDETGQLSCDPCPSGTFQDELGQTMCKATPVCQAGTRQTVAPTTTTARTCVDCAVGLFQDEDNQMACEVCPSETFQNEVGSIGCKPATVCVAGTRQDVAPTRSTDRELSLIHI